MANPYSKYLRRLKGRINQNDYYAAARRTAFATSPKQSTFDTYLRKENVPVGVAAQMELDQQAQRQRSLTGVVERAGAKDIERKDILGAKIDELKFKSDEYDKQKEEGLWSAGLQVAGAIGGALLAAPTGGMSMLAGAQLGASGGMLLSGLGVGGADANAADIAGGLVSGIQTFTQISTDKKMIEMGNMGGEAYEIMSGLEGTARGEFLSGYEKAYDKRAYLDQYLKSQITSLPAYMGY